MVQPACPARSPDANTVMQLEYVFNVRVMVSSLLVVCPVVHARPSARLAHPSMSV